MSCPFFLAKNNNLVAISVPSFNIIYLKKWGSLQYYTMYVHFLYKNATHNANFKYSRGDDIHACSRKRKSIGKVNIYRCLKTLIMQKCMKVRWRCRYIKQMYMYKSKYRCINIFLHTDPRPRQDTYMKPLIFQKFS